MNFSKSLILKFSVVCLVSSFCILLFSFFTLKSNENNNLDNEKMLISEAISWNEAKTLMSRFKVLQPLKTEFADSRSPTGSSIVPLEGFKISANQLLEIINNNKSGNGQIADNVMFYFGATDPKPGFTTTDFKIIAVGEKNGNLMVPTSTADMASKGTSSIFDKADPCPPMCPNQE